MAQTRVLKPRISGRVAAKIMLGAGMARLDLEGDGLGVGVRAGHFAMVSIPGHDECVLPRPFSYFITRSPNGASFLIKDVGKGTRALIEAELGTEVWVLGPLGNSFPRHRGPVWAVAGGVGVAPFGELARQDGFRLIFGARSAAETMWAESFSQEGGAVVVATENGSAGFGGTVVDLLQALRGEGQAPAAMFTCGPSVMMDKVARLGRNWGLPVWVSLEERMGCGVGVCRGCSHPDARGQLRCICGEGPVFPAEEIYGA